MIALAPDELTIDRCRRVMQPTSPSAAVHRVIAGLTGIVLALVVAPVFAVKLALTGAAGFPNGRTANDVPLKAIDGDIATFTWTTNPNNIAAPSYLAVSFDASFVNRLRLWKEKQGGGGNNSKNLVILYTTNVGALESRQWTPVTNLRNGYAGSEFMRATAVNPDATVIEDVHDSTSGDGWASLTFNSVKATG